MRRCISERVGKDGRVIPPSTLDFIVCLLARLRIGVEGYCPVGVVVEGRMTQAQKKLPGRGAAFYQRWSGVPLGC
jgi:hypothetical protein